MSAATGFLDGVPIVGLTGINGAGKTLIAVESAIADMKRGRTVYSTVPISFDGMASKPIRTLRELTTIRDSTILLDEVAVILSSSAGANLPHDVYVMLHTLRHTKNSVRWTAPAWMRAHNQLREVTQGLVNVVPLLRKVDPGNPWPTPRFVLTGLMDTTTGVTDETPTRVMRRRISRTRSLAAWGSYDTLADTPTVGGFHAGGACLDCGGSIVRPKHTQARHEELGLPWYEDEPGISQGVHFVDAEPQSAVDALPADG